MKRRSCARCGNTFKPAKPLHKYCPSCFNDTQPVGWTRTTQRSNAPDRRHGGISNLRNERRSVILRGNQTRISILEGFKSFLSDLYGQPAGLSTVLSQAGMTDEQIHALNADAQLNVLIMDFIPQLYKWLIETLGKRPAEILDAHYGLYGNEPMPLQSIASNFGFTDEKHARNYLRKILRPLRTPTAQQELQRLALKAATAQT